MTNPLRKAVPIVAACSLVATACGGGGHSSKFMGSPSGTTHSGNGKSQGGSHTVSFKFASSSAGPETVSIPSQPLGTSPTTTQGITLQVWVLKRVQPNAVLAVFGPSITRAAGQSDSIGNDATSAVENGLEDSPTYNDAQIGLLDVGALKEYQVYESDSSGSPCLCTKAEPGLTFDWSSSSSSNQGNNSGTTPTQGGGDSKSFLMAALVTAPPANVNKVTVITGFAQIPDLPISG